MDNDHLTRPFVHKHTHTPRMHSSRHTRNDCVLRAVANVALIAMAMGWMDNERREPTSEFEVV